MTQIASIRRPGNVTIVAGATKTPFGDVGHPEIVGADAHLESQLGVANLATETDPVKPVGKHHRPHAFLFRPPVQHYIGILRVGGRNDSEQSCAEQQGKLDPHGRLHLGGTAPGGIAIGRDGLRARPGLGTL